MVSREHCVVFFGKSLYPYFWAGRKRSLGSYADLKCYYDEILETHFFPFSHTIGLS